MHVAQYTIHSNGLVAWDEGDLMPLKIVRLPGRSDCVAWIVPISYQQQVFVDLMLDTTPLVWRKKKNFFANLRNWWISGTLQFVTKQHFPIFLLNPWAICEQFLFWPPSTSALFSTARILGIAWPGFPTNSAHITQGQHYHQRSSSSLRIIDKEKTLNTRSCHKCFF